MWPVTRIFGELELRDIEDGLTWLKSQPYTPKSRHGVTDPLLLKHMRQMMLDFIVENL
jgi:hypothetical protein